MLVPIDDPGDPRIADYRNVPDPDLAARRGLFVAEGRLVVGRLLSDGRLTTRSVMVTQPALTALGDLLDRHHDVPVYLVPQPVMNTVTGFNIHRGCLAIGERPPEVAWQTLAGSIGRLIVLERVANADNVGAIFRNAAALGAGGVLLGPDCADPLYRKAIRTSMGAALTVPFARVEPWPALLREARDLGYAVIGLTPAPATPSLRDVAQDVGREARVALVAGHEGDGLWPETLRHCDRLARIPMSPDVDSLNVATAVALGLYEFGR